MKLRIGSSFFFLLQTRVPAHAFSSPIISHVLRKRSASRLSFTAFRGGCSIHGSNNNRNTHGKEYKATISPSEEVTQEGESNSLNHDGDDIKQQIKEEAIQAINITGPSTFIDTFGGITFVNTSKLNTGSESTSSKLQQHRVLFVLGGPGAGKGTQSENIVAGYKCIHLSVGELLRKERQRGDESPHAELIESCLVAGNIVPVEISLGLVRNAMDEAILIDDKDDGALNKYGQPIFLVDGFPRNYDNLSGWTKNMPNYAACLGSLVYDCSMDVLEQRILGRAATSGRSDDNLESARKRFKTFQQQTMPVVHALEEVEKMQMANDDEVIGKLHIHHIIGEGTVDEVWDATKKAMDGYIKNDILSANAQLLQAIEAEDVSKYASLASIEMLSTSTQEGDQSHDENVEIDINKGFQVHELIDDCSNGTVNHISNATIEFPTGTKAIVSYNRRIEDKATGEVKSEFRETRVWSHEQQGWMCIHFVRKPLSDQ